MSIWMQRRMAPKQPVTTLGEPAAETATRLGQKIDGRKLNKHVRTKQFNTKVRDGFLDDLDKALDTFCAAKGVDTVSRGYFLEVLLYNWMQANGQEVRPYGLPALALEYAEAIAARMQWTLEQAIEDAIAARAKNLQIDLNTRDQRR